MAKTLNVYFPIVLEARSLRSGCQHGQVQLKASLSGLQTAIFCLIAQVALPCCGGWRKVLSSSYKVTSPVILVLQLYALFNFHFFLNTYLRTQSDWGLGHQHMNWAGGVRGEHHWVHRSIWLEAGPRTKGPWIQNPQRGGWDEGIRSLGKWSSLPAILRQNGHSSK